MAIAILNTQSEFPDPGRADGEGLVAVGGRMTVPRLLKAYRSGIFPWTASPVTWWSPDPRGVLEFDGFHVSRSFRRLLRQNKFGLTRDEAFLEVIKACAAPAPGRRST